MNQQDELTPAEHLADACARQQSRGRHGITEFAEDERYRRIRTEMAERALEDLGRRGFTLSRPRVVETVEELDELPKGSVVLTEQGGVYEAGDRGFDGEWWETGQEWAAASTDLALPATVIHLPEETP